ncbi:hypothetical protein LIN78_06420 [Leeia sp. TBRC 13508]|uniref:DUF4131 domain-containing protein n=1 Tax=Leeia speluncae TaxID=2884804 RepID=A0ABS8D4N1_9NEIS|nr:hypothetical protein [Leeia speluncae]MCB6183174.1 hypothetical protein [Leeia speluncae]
MKKQSNFFQPNIILLTVSLVITLGFWGWSHTFNDTLLWAEAFGIAGGVLMVWRCLLTLRKRQIGLLTIANIVVLSVAFGALALILNRNFPSTPTFKTVLTIQSISHGKGGIVVTLTDKASNTYQSFMHLPPNANVGDQLRMTLQMGGLGFPFYEPNSLQLQK